ncbi:hypothetical protein D9758_012384 [Tetrapyrgos nigripes]|uniref:DUF659 domain-containing protein n=1 Tax=Tetrapyrgos nigripes TaxID=182062 RepID=A0A8H5D6F3_9AGAR|nr:hypothetical protein D9758_012384 [Tetrapyrgos nigripes]
MVRRDVLSGQILNEEVGKADMETRAEVNGQFGTGQSDRWKNITKRSLITSMVNINYKTHLLNVADILSQPKTAESLLEIILKEIEHIKSVLLVTLVAWCTDCSGESLKMQQLLQEHFEWIIVLDCWAHQFNLVVGDILKLKLPMVKVTDQALEVIKWFLSHSITLGLVNDQQRQAQFLVILIVELKVQLIKTAGTKAAAKAKALQILHLIGYCATSSNHLQLLPTLFKQITANLTPSSFSLCIFSTFITTVPMMHEFIMLYLLASRNIGRRLTEKVFKQFYGKPPDNMFCKVFSEYMSRAGKWSDEVMGLDDWHQDAKQNINPIREPFPK